MKKLIVFAISHYCEMARWALDWHQVPYEEVFWPPGLHLILAKRLGAESASVPILQLDDGTLVQGTAKIIDWADGQAPEGGRRLTNPEALEIEARADKVLGVNVRRLVYAECLKDHPQVVKPALFHNLSPGHNAIGKLLWPLTRIAMTKAYGLSPEAAGRAREKLEAEFDAFDQIVSDGRTYLAGKTFSRADLAVASLLSPIARPDAMPLYQEMDLPEVLKQDFERWSGRPILRWAARMYREHR